MGAGLAAAEDAGLGEDGEVPGNVLLGGAERFRQLGGVVGATTDFFIRTTDPEHAEGVARVMERLRESGDVYRGAYAGWYCPSCERFYAEAERAYARARELSPDDLLLNYNLAALYALWGKPPEAIEALRRALAADAAKVRGWLQTDPMFDGLKGKPEFEDVAHG